MLDVLGGWVGGWVGGKTYPVERRAAFCFEEKGRTVCLGLPEIDIFVQAVDDEEAGRHCDLFGAPKHAGADVNGERKVVAPFFPTGAGGWVDG